MSALTPSPGRSTFTAIGTCVASAALVTFAAYGDPHPEKGQENAVPFLIAVSCVTAAIAFGLLVPRMVDTVGGRRWALGAGMVAAAATPVAFWAGAPLALGVAAVVGGLAGLGGPLLARPRRDEVVERSSEGRADRLLAARVAKAGHTVGPTWLLDRLG